MTDARDDTLFERAREADIEAVAGVKLYRAGRRMRGECPICGASSGKKAGGAFSIEKQLGVFKCFGCDAGGGVIDLERLLRGGTAREAALRLAGDAPAAPRLAQAPSTAAEPPKDRRAFAERLWTGASAASASPVRTYLASRGITGRVAAQALQALRYHPEAFWGVDDHGAAIAMPAMIARTETPSGPTGGVHVTYLAAGGAGKTWRQPAKRMWGPQAGPEGPGGCWLLPLAPAGAGPCLVGEGIESTLAAAILHGAAGGAVATLSLRALQGGVLADRFGRIDPDLITADRESPAFTWPGVAEAAIAVDRDMKPVRIKARRATGGTYERTLTSDERARLCAGLAAQAWRRAGATKVTTIAPGPGRDFNDELLARRDDA